MRISVVTAAAFLVSQSEAFAPAALGVKRTSTFLQSSLAPNGVAATKTETTVAAAPKVAQRWRKSTKQLVTLGPASSSLEVSTDTCCKGRPCYKIMYLTLSCCLPLIR